MISPFNDLRNLVLYRWFCALVSALCLTWFVSWIFQIGGFLPMLAAMTSFLLSPWVTMSGGHLFWVFGIAFAPIAYLGFALHKGVAAFQFWRMGLFLALFFFLKSLFMGYEIVTATLVMGTIPVFYYAFRQKWSFSLFVKRFFWASGSLLTGLILSVLFLLAQMQGLPDNSPTGIKHLKSRFELRTSGNLHSAAEPPLRIIESREATLSETMKKYWGQSMVRAPKLRRGGQRWSNLIVPSSVVLGMALLLGVAGLFWSKIRPLAAALLVSFLAPASWFIIFKAHSYLHPFLDHLAWFLPTVPLAWALGGLYVQEMVLWLRKKRVVPVDGGPGK